MSLEDIKSRLERISPCPWGHEKGDEASCVVTPVGPLTWDDHGGEVFNENDAQFIANAPADMAQLIETLETIMDLPKISGQDQMPSLGDWMYAEGYNHALEIIQAIIGTLESSVDTEAQ